MADNFEVILVCFQCYIDRVWDELRTIDDMNEC